MRRCPLFSLVVLAAVVSVPAVSCLSPTLPLPPPDAPSTIVAGTTEGTWEVYGSANPWSTVTVFNDNTGRGVVVEDRTGSGGYHVTLAGAECDTAWLKQDVDGIESAPTYFVLAPRDSSTPTDNPACH